MILGEAKIVRNEIEHSKRFYLSPSPHKPKTAQTYRNRVL